MAAAKKKAPLTAAQQANAEARRQEWAEFKAWKEAQAATPATPTAAAPGVGKPTRRERFQLEDSDEVTTVQGFDELGPEIAELARQNQEGGHKGQVTHTSAREAVVYDRRGIAKRVLRSAWLA